MTSNAKRIAALAKRDVWIKPFLSRYAKTLALALALGCCTVVFAAGLMFTSGWLIAGSAEMPYSVLLLGTPLLCVRVFGVGKPIVRYCERLASHDWVLRLTSGLRKQLYLSFNEEGVFFRSTHRLGDALGLLAEDIEHVQNLYLRCVFPSVIALTIGIGLCVAFGYFSSLAAFVCFLFVTLELIVVPVISVNVNGARQLRTKELDSERYASCTDALMGITDWTLSGRKRDFLNEWNDKQQELDALKKEAHSFDRKRDLAQSAIFALGIVVLVCWCALMFGGAQGGQANWILAFTLGAFPLLDAFAPLPAAATLALGHFDSIERLNELPIPEKGKNASGSCSLKPRLAADTLASPCLKISEAYFSYPEQEPVIAGMSLCIPPGQHIALLGKSGSGKTTLAHLMRGDLHPTKGSITVGGISCAELGNEASRVFSVCQQETYLFNDTLRNNLLIAQPEANDEALKKTLERVGLQGLLERLPEGLDTLVDEAGLRFSGGERHRIAFARTLLQDAPIVILDEPTVSLDPHTEQEVLATMLEVFADKTVVLITHHLQGVQDMDRVLFLEDGHIALDGSPDELKRTSIHYRSLLALETLQRGSAPSGIHRQG